MYLCVCVVATSAKCFDKVKRETSTSRETPLKRKRLLRQSLILRWREYADTVDRTQGSATASYWLTLNVICRLLYHTTR